MSENPQASGAKELRLAPESIEALATRLAEVLGAARAPECPSLPPRLLSAAEVARWWGVERSWVYSHAEELGARRLGTGPRPRLRFDPDEVTEALGAPARPLGIGGDRRGLPPIDGDSLSARRRAIVAEQGKQAAGRREDAPGPAPKNVLRRDTNPSPAGHSRRRHFAAEEQGDER
ncbi:MAG: hypothetical protein FVQ78_05820 [Solirubrobacterales bacterium]|nr:hypothetical protein [Solirubrobacterales bacterium]